jgi:hypothetical protein
MSSSSLFLFLGKLGKGVQGEEECIIPTATKKIREFFEALDVVVFYFLPIFAFFCSLEAGYGALWVIRFLFLLGLLELSELELE